MLNGAKYSRNLRYYMRNGNDAEIGAVLRRVFNTFVMQYRGDPGVSQEKFDDWLERVWKSIGTHPKLRQFSLEELKAKYIRTSQHAVTTRSMFAEQLRDIILKERVSRAISSEGQSGGQSSTPGLLQ